MIEPDHFDEKLDGGATVQQFIVPLRLNELLGAVKVEGLACFSQKQVTCHPSSKSAGD